MISENTLAQIRDRTDLAALVNETVKLKRSGRSWLGLCPFHKEKSPSFSVNAERGYWRCFGCKEHGSAIDFVMKQEGKTFPEAARALAERAGITIEDTRTDAERKEAAAARRVTDDLYDVNALAAMFYEHSLRGGPGTPAHPMAHHAVSELARRGLTADNEAMTAFRIGYAPHAWDALTVYLQKQGVSPATAERAGLLVPRTSGGGYYDRFRHRLMFPVLDVQGRVVAFSGRTLPGSDAEGAKYINSPESPIYTKGEHLFGLYQARQAIRQSGEAVLVEGNFDVFSLHARGVQNVVAPLGTAFTEHQARLLRRFAPSVTLMFDGDDAGKKATWAARAPCRAAGLSVRGAAVPAGMDPDAIAQKQGAATVKALLAGAPPLAQRLLDVLLRDGEFEGRAVHDQAARVRAALQLVSEAGDDVERTVLRSYADRLAQGLRVGGLQELEAALRRPAKPATPARPATTLHHEMSLAMLGALVDFPELLDHPDVQSRAALMTGAPVLGLLALRGPMDTLLARVPNEVNAFVAQRLAAPLFETQDEALRSFRAFAKKIAAANLRAPKDAA